MECEWEWAREPADAGLDTRVRDTVDGQILVCSKIMQSKHALYSYTITAPLYKLLKQ